MITNIPDIHTFLRLQISSYSFKYDENTIACSRQNLYIFVSKIILCTCCTEFVRKI